MLRCSVRGCFSDIPREAIRLAAAPPWVLAVVGFLWVTSIAGPVLAEGANSVRATDAQNETVTKLTTFADTFRLLAAGDPQQAITQNASTDFLKKWKALYLPLFAEQEAQLADFFCGAVVFIGRIEGTRGVSVLYNPWCDGAFIMGVDVGGRKILDGALCCGEALRGSTIAHSAGAIPEWQTAKKTVAKGVGDVYLRTSKAFEVSFPTFAEYQCFPGDLAGRVATPKEELAFLKLRLFARMKMYKDQILQPEKGGRAEQLQQVLVRLRKALRSESAEDFVKLVSSSQDKSITRNIFLLPREARGRLTPYYVLCRPEGCVAVLVNPSMPLWFCTVHTRNDKQEVSIERVDLFNFEKLDLLN